MQYVVRMSKQDERLLERLQRVATLMDRIGLPVVGARVKRLRLQQGHSIRSFATLSGLGKNSVVRLEAGTGTQPLTLLRACEALGLHIDRLADPVAQDTEVAVAHRNGDDRWGALMDLAGTSLAGARATDTSKQRAKLAHAHHVGVLINRLRSRLPSGRAFPSILELHAASEPRSHPGEEFVYVLDGRVRLDVGGHEFVLSRGESLMFYSAERHVYAPADDTEQVPQLLCVRIEG